MKILIPHLGYTVFVKPKNNSRNHVAWVEADPKTPNECTLFMNLPVKTLEIPTLAHELTHVLQFICESRHITFSEEKEHMGYLMNFLMNRVIGIEYNV